MTTHSSRTIDGNTIISSDLPALRIQVDAAMSYIGRIDFALNDTAAGERIIFAQVQGKSVPRMLIAQFEWLLPATTQRYNYRFDDAITLAGYQWRTNPYAFSNAAALADAPQAEAALTYNFLLMNGIVPQDEWMMYRYLTVPDAAKRHELIIFYIEPLASSGATLNQLYDLEAQTETALWQRIYPGLAARAATAFSLEPYHETR